MSSESSLNVQLSKKILGIKLWVLICISVGAFIILILCFLSIWVTFRRKSRRSVDKFSVNQIPNVSKDIRIDRVGAQSTHDHPDNLFVTVHDKATDKNSENMFAHLGMSKSSDPDNMSQCSSVYHHERAFSSLSGEEGSSGTVRKQSSLSHGGLVTASPLIGLPEVSHLGWGHWFTLRDLQFATNRFSAENVLGEGGYGVVYKGKLINGTEVAVKKLLNNMGQAEKEFRVEVEAIGHVRHKNLVRLLGYCIEGVHRTMAAWGHASTGHPYLGGPHEGDSWYRQSVIVRILLATRARYLSQYFDLLSYLHEAIEPKVIHRDIKSSNILIDDEFNSKVSDFGLAKLLDSGESHITTRVMGTFGYVAPEYANTGLLNEKSDIYSFGVLLLEAVTGRDPVDYGRPANEVNLVEWLKLMVGARRAEEVVDPNLEAKPSTRSLKRVLLVALRCVDHDAENRPKMSQVVRMLEADEYPFREDRRNRKTRTTSMEIESLKENYVSGDTENKLGDLESQTAETTHA
ncbi:hypothetical protein ACLB2K_062484 [Fragaria x ananassa]